MKQLLYEVYNEDSLSDSIHMIQAETAEREPKSMVFHMYIGMGIAMKDVITSMAKTLKRAFPQAVLVGAASNAEIFEGHVTDPEIVLSCLLFYETEVDVLSMPDICGMETEAGISACRFVDRKKDIKAAEVLICSEPVEGVPFFRQMEKCNRDVVVFGGLPMTHDINVTPSFLLDERGIIRRGVVVVTYSGKNFHINEAHTAGWKTLGRTFKVTKAKGNMLYMVDNFPAFRLYERYLNIPCDDSFMENVMEFPLMISKGDVHMLRHPASSTSDMSLALAGYVEEGMDVNIAYGDPSVIIDDVNKRLVEVHEFQPEAILIYSCTMRKIFWSYFINKEMEPFQRMAQTGGFYTGGEINRDMNTGMIMWHNITLLSICMREGEKHGEPVPQAFVDTSTLRGQVGLIRRLTTLVRVTTDELHEAFEELMQVNEKLRYMAIMDKLTELYNRREIERRINEALEHTKYTGKPIALVMFDVDHFKHVNDTYGHDTGDKILEGVAAVLNSMVRDSKGEAGGRWGGEEFFMLLPNDTLAEAEKRAEELRATVEAYPFPKVPKLTISLGVTTGNWKEDRKAVYARVDDALYQAKEGGRNQVVTIKAPIK